MGKGNAGAVPAGLSAKHGPEAKQSPVCYSRLQGKRERNHGKHQGPSREALPRGVSDPSSSPFRGKPQLFQPKKLFQNDDSPPLLLLPSALIHQGWVMGTGVGDGTEMGDGDRGG